MQFDYVQNKGISLWNLVPNLEFSQFFAFLATPIVASVAYTEFDRRKFIYWTSVFVYST